jgi:hypothetical protein
MYTKFRKDWVQHSHFIVTHLDTQQTDIIKQKQTRKSIDFSTQASYTDGASAAGRKNV